MITSQNPANVNEYIALFAPETQLLLEQVRSVIKQSAPEAEEVISYGMPAYKLKGILVYFAGYKNHIGFYPTGKGIESFKKEISGYKSGKGSIQFPLDKPLPLDLIADIVRFRVIENKEKAEARLKKK